jgi:hypothetical protein
VESYAIQQRVVAQFYKVLGTLFDLLKPQINRLDIYSLVGSNFTVTVIHADSTKKIQRVF